MTAYEKNNEIKIKVGDKVIDKQGLQGTVTEVRPETLGDGTVFCVQWETGKFRVCTLSETSLDLQLFYLIGSFVVGNKCNENELLKGVEKIDSEIAKLQFQKRQLKKQLWRWREVMVPDWKERQANKKKLPPNDD